MRRMNVLSMAVLALACLTPLVASAQKTPTPEAPFVRLERDAKGVPTAMQTSIVKYAGQGGVEIDLISVVHVGDKAYYEHLNKVFDRYDTVLYELVAPAGTRPRKGEASQSLDPLNFLYRQMAEAAQLEQQMAVIDYQKAHLVHADLPPDVLLQKVMNWGPAEWMATLTDLYGYVQRMVEEVKSDRQLPQSGDGRPDPLALKRLLAEQLVEAGGEIGQGKPIHKLIVEDRNSAALSVLEQQLAAGKKKIAIFYGAAHMPDFDKRLAAKYGMKRTGDEWLIAWNLAGEKK